MRDWAYDIIGFLAMGAFVVGGLWLVYGGYLLEVVQP